MRNYVIRCLFFMLISFAVVAAEDEDWREFKMTDKENILFFGFEESELMKGRIGQWLPRGIFRVQGPWVKWRLVKLSRKDDRAFIEFALCGERDKIETITWSWHNPGKDGDLSTAVVEEGDRVYISLPQRVMPEEKETSRRLMLLRAQSVDELKNTITISKAALLWEWETAKVDNL